jgi:uncharacterized membrane protein YciS (DUF1049 family)
MRTAIWIVVLGAATAYAVYLGTQLEGTVDLDLLFVQLPSAPLWSVVLGAFGLGAVLTGLSVAWPLLRLRLGVRRQGRQISRLEQEVHGLRTLPLAHDEPAPGKAERA